jgi:vancomycin aglycone glucosyltransferase
MVRLAKETGTDARGIRYAFAAYCPATFPSPDHPPLKMRSHFSQSLPTMINRFLWRRDRLSWDALFLKTLNEERAKVILSPVASVQRHIFSDRPWLAADAAIAPAASTPDMQIVQTGAWLLPDQRPLPEPLESFLAKGEPAADVPAETSPGWMSRGQ